MKYQVGDRVKAAARIYETHVDGRLELAARPGDEGTVEHVSRNGYPLVRWARSGWAIDCAPEELEHDRE